MEGAEYVVHRFSQLPYRWKSALRRDDQVYSQLHLLHESDEELKTDLILVAGLGGHYYETWRAIDGTIWPQELLPLKQYGMGGVRVWSFEYNTTLRGASSVRKMDDHARELLALISLKLMGSWSGTQPKGGGPEQLKPIIFVGHSLGGMLIKKAIIIAETEKNFEDVWLAIRGAVGQHLQIKSLPIEIWTLTAVQMFFAVPHHGLDIADWKRFVTLVLKANAPVPGMQPTIGMERQAAANGKALLEITHEFRRFHEILFFVNYTEGRSMKGLGRPLIAEGRSWMDAPSVIQIKLDGDHLGICKFEKEDEQNQITGRFDQIVTDLKYLMGASKALTQIGKEARKALDSLCPMGFHGYFMTKQATVGTCRWITEREPFQDWVSSDKESRMLWIQGPASSGKSFLTRHIITDLIPPSTTQKVAHCFLDDSVPGRRRLEHLLRATLHHALRVEPELIHRYLVPPYLQAVETLDVDVPDDDDIWTLEILVPLWPQVVAEVTSRGVLTIVVDGFSEMSLECQQGFLNCLDDFKLNKAQSQEQRDCLKVLLVSRGDTETEGQLEGRGDFEVYNITPEDVQQDIERTVMAVVTDADNWEGQDAEFARQRLQGLDEHHIEDIRDTIVTSSGGNFLLAKMKAQVASESLILDSPSMTLELVKHLPDDVAGMYDERLKGVQEGSPYLPFIKQLLRWATFQMEPLREGEINTAVALGVARDGALAGQVSTQSLETIQKQFGGTRSMIEKYTRQLIEIQEGILQPVNGLLKERLTEANNGNVERMEEGPSHAALASTCISYLTMEYFEDSQKPIAKSLEEKVKQRIKDYAFSRYAALHWMDHVEAAGAAWQGVDNHVIHARRLLEDDTTHYGICYSEISWLLRRGTMNGYATSCAEAHAGPAATPLSNRELVSSVESPYISIEMSDAGCDEADENGDGSQLDIEKAVPDSHVTFPPEHNNGGRATTAESYQSLDNEAEASEEDLASHRNQFGDLDVEAEPSDACQRAETSIAGGHQIPVFESHRPELVVLADNRDADDIFWQEGAESPGPVQEPEIPALSDQRVLEQHAGASWRPEDIFFSTEEEQRSSISSEIPLASDVDTEDAGLDTQPADHKPLTALEQSVRHSNDSLTLKSQSLTELERQHEPSSLSSQMQRNIDLLDPMSQEFSMDGGQEEFKKCTNDTTTERLLPPDVSGIQGTDISEETRPDPDPKPTSHRETEESLFTRQVPTPARVEKAPEAPIFAAKMPTLTPQPISPIAQSATPTHVTTLDTPHIEIEGRDSNVNPMETRLQSEDYNMDAPTLHDGRRMKGKAVQLPQTPKLNYPISQAYPTTSTIIRDGLGTISTVMPRSHHSAWDSENQNRPGLHDYRATGSTSLLPYGHVGIRDRRGHFGEYSFSEANDDQDNEDSEADESVLADGTKRKKKRHFLKRAFDKTKKIVKGVARK